MLRYRALLIDTAKSYQRPVQQFFNDIETATDWAKKTLAGASPHATVCFYRTTEKEMHSLSREDVFPSADKEPSAGKEPNAGKEPSDQIPVQGVQ